MPRFAPSLALLCILLSCKSAEPGKEAATSTPAAAAAGPTTATLSMGANAPSFELPNHDGASVGLAGLTAEGPAVLVFYRGDW